MLLGLDASPGNVQPSPGRAHGVGEMHPPRRVPSKAPPPPPGKHLEGGAAPPPGPHPAQITPPLQQMADRQPVHQGRARPKNIRSLVTPSDPPRAPVPSPHPGSGAGDAPAQVSDSWGGSKPVINHPCW